MNRSSIIRYHRRKPTQRTIRTLADRLLDCGLAVVPSETQYALCALATSRRAVDAARSLKGRDGNRPFSAFFRDAGGLHRWGVELDGYALVLAEQLWPGPVTLVLPARGVLAKRLGASEAIGVRISPEPVLERLLARLDAPVVATSANPSGIVLSAVAENRWLAGLAQSGRILWVRPEIYRRRPASTVIDCTGRRPRELRGGAIPTAEWRAVLK